MKSMTNNPIKSSRQPVKYAVIKPLDNLYVLCVKTLGGRCILLAAATILGKRSVPFEDEVGEHHPHTQTNENEACKEGKSSTSPGGRPDGARNAQLYLS